MLNAFVETVKNIYPISKTVEKQLLKRLVSQISVVGEIIIKEGEINDKLFFIQKGMVRSYYFIEDHGVKHEVTSSFVGEFGFIYIPHSFIGQVPCMENVELLEDSELIYITYKSLHELYSLHPESNIIGRELTEMYLVTYDERVRLLRMMSAQKRNDIFQMQYPNIYERAPKKYIASFLGLTPETLSRVRKNHKSN